MRDQFELDATADLDRAVRDAIRRNAMEHRGAVDFATRQAERGEMHAHFADGEQRFHAMVSMDFA
jgi:hypothetical protein